MVYSSFEATMRQRLVRAALPLIVSLLAAGPQMSRSAAASAGADAGLSSAALEHLRRGAEYYDRRLYSKAETEFARVAYLAPEWHAVHFNMGANAEAQGKLDKAIESYTAYLRHADERGRRAAELRITELGQRRNDLLKTHRHQVAAGWSLIGGGLAVSAGGWVMLAYGARSDNGYLIASGWVLGLVALGAPLGGIERLTKARKTKQKIRGLALSPTGSRTGLGGHLAFQF
jgi:tetratricopeptide (TPR) repeat protein